MTNISAVVQSIRNIMRNDDKGISGDAQRLEQLGWMLFLKILDAKEQEFEKTKENYISIIPTQFQWRNWAMDNEGITGDELLKFIDGNLETGEKGLFTSLRELQSVSQNKQFTTIKNVFDNLNNYMKSGYAMRRVINELNKIDFNKLADRQVFGTIYESILKELRDAGNKGEYYTPRAITKLMTQLTDPKLNEKILDPTAGTGGFLTAAIDHIKQNYVKTVEDEQSLQQNIIGWELKPVAFALGLTNLVLHGIDTPNYEYIDSLNQDFRDVSQTRKVDVILANPPFGASINSQINVESNFPATYRCKESADLFVVAILQLLKENGRAAIVLPDGSITGDGVKARIREKLLTEANLHTIIRLPQSTFFPATVSTNLLFFEKGKPTDEIWYYQHNLPEGQKSYSKTKAIKFKEFEPIIEWWDNRIEKDNVWKVKANELKNFDLDIKNPNQAEEETLKTSKEYLNRMKLSFEKSNQLISELENLIN